MNSTTITTKQVTKLLMLLRKFIEDVDDVLYSPATLPLDELHDVPDDPDHEPTILSTTLGGRKPRTK